MTVCQGICENYKVKRPHDLSPYFLGLKQCTYCEVFLEWNGKLCPCCKTKLRANPRTKNQKAKLRKNIKEKVLKSLVSVAALSSITGICINHGLQHMLHSIFNIL